MTGTALQTLVVALIVGAAAFYVGRRLWRTIAAARASKGCAAGCGCEEPGGARLSALGSRQAARDAEPPRTGVPRS